jgi:hypothetical protein
MLNRCSNLRRQKCDDEKYTKKVLKHTHLTAEIQCMVNLETNVIPVILRATGTISKSFIKYLSNVPRKHEIKELQKTVILGTAHILRKVLMQKYSRFNIGNNAIYTTNSNYSIAATLYTLQTWFVSGVHKCKHSV